MLSFIMPGGDQNAVLDPRFQRAGDRARHLGTHPADVQPISKILYRLGMGVRNQFPEGLGIVCALIYRNDCDRGQFYGPVQQKNHRLRGGIIHPAILGPSLSKGTMTYLNRRCPKSVSINVKAEGAKQNDEPDLQFIFRGHGSWRINFIGRTTVND